MVEILLKWDSQLFLLLNGIHSPFWDSIMIFASGKLNWLPLYLLIIFFIALKNRWKTLWWLIAIAIVVVATDQLSVGLFKNVFQRLRPCHNSELQGLIHLVGRCGGQYGFVSSHAANTFGVAVFLSLLFSKRWITYSLLIWAAFVSYSRIYLGVHFPGDVICGAILGAGIGISLWLPANYFINRMKWV
ncbi:MAG: phosphatase PAP2 family protein [Bacteroidales bacterium]|nr:MAG: phosphatase PAP2 family protein [Bacteroidales bacterium]